MELSSCNVINLLLYFKSKHSILAVKMFPKLVLLLVAVHAAIIMSVQPAVVRENPVWETAVGGQQTDVRVTYPRQSDTNSGAGQLLLDYLEATPARQVNVSRRCVGSLWRQALSACRMRELAEAMVAGRNIHFDRVGENEDSHASSQRNLRPTRGISNICILLSHYNIIAEKFKYKSREKLLRDDPKSIIITG